MPKIKELTIEKLRQICDYTGCLDCPLDEKGLCYKSDKICDNEYLEKDIDYDMIVYQKLCVGCPSERYCHENCGTCEQYDEDLKMLEEEDEE